MAEFREIKGSIFDSNCQAIVNTVNCKGFMGKGIALEYKYRFPDMFKDYAEKCSIHKIKVGQLELWVQSTPWIINFPTKNDWKHPSKIEYIKKGLSFIVDNYKTWKIKSIAFPRLGSSHGGLNWSDVQKIMHQILSKTDLLVEIYEFDSTYQDKLFLSLIGKLNKMNLKEYVSQIKLTKKSANILNENVKNNLINNFSDIQKIPKFGKKSIEKIYPFKIY